MVYLNRNHVTEKAGNIVQWTEAAGSFTFSKNEQGVWRAVSVTQPFAMDVWTAQHGFELWVGDDGRKSREVVLVSVSEPLPAKPDGKLTCIYSVRVYSAEMGGQRDLVVKHKAPTDAFCDFFDSIVADHPDNATVPIVRVTSKISDFGTAPVFDIQTWKPRPAHWVKPTVSFN
jgi:hypothetical protein